MSLTSVLASASHPIAATARAALLCTMLLVEFSGSTMAVIKPWLWMVRRKGSCMAKLVRTEAALATAPSLLQLRTLMSGSMASASATALESGKRK